MSLMNRLKKILIKIILEIRWLNKLNIKGKIIFFFVPHFQM